MKILNVHQRVIDVPAREVGCLLDTLASADDRMWPHERWPALTASAPLQVGAIVDRAGLGTDTVAQYAPGSHIRFVYGKKHRSYHEFTVTEVSVEKCLLTHTLNAQPSIARWCLWSIGIRLLHDALMDDLLDKVESQLVAGGRQRAWSLTVRFLRRVARVEPATSHQST